MTDTTPKVSVLTTVYNRAQFLAECIESVQQSRLTDYEHIIVDDGSTDDSVAIANRYAAQDPKIKVFVNEQNLGDYPNRNQAAKHASGKYLKYLDADDLHGPWILNIMVDAMEQFPEAGFGLIEYGKNAPTFPIQLSGAQAQDDFYSKQRNIFNRSPLNSIIKREVFETVGGFSGKRMVGDFEMWHVLSQKHSVVVIPSGLAHYRKHDDQEMTEHARDPIWGFRYLLISRFQLIDNQNPMPHDRKAHHLKCIERRMARAIVMAIKNHGLNKASEMRKESNWTWRKVISSAFS